MSFLGFMAWKEAGIGPLSPRRGVSLSVGVRVYMVEGIYVVHRSEELR